MESRSEEEYAIGLLSNEVKRLFEICEEVVDSLDSFNFFLMVWRTVKISSTFDLFGPKPTWYCGMIAELIAWMHPSIALVSILAAWLVRLIGR